MIDADDIDAEYYGLSALTLAVRFYDHMREHASENGARVQAEMYLRRKVPALDRIGAAIVLADALAIRATARLHATANGETMLTRRQAT